jgi:hypothetical protein
MWEVFTRGEHPYYDITDNKEVIVKVLKGERLKKPSDCPNEFYEIMQR